MIFENCALFNIRFSFCTGITHRKKMTRKHILAAFDFDHTIVEDNSDIVARKLINAELIPENVRKLYQKEGWTEYMSEIFKLLHKHKVSRETIIEAMQKMTPTPNMPKLLQWLKSEGLETIIISDSNSVFIEEWLNHTNLNDCVARVFTNPASFEENGLLTIRPYQFQDWCQLSQKSLCKGYILENYVKERLEEGVTFDALAFVGDGTNDFCPSLKLSQDDFVFPRLLFPLDSKIKDPHEVNKVVAQVFPWEDAAEIMSSLKNIL